MSLSAVGGLLTGVPANANLQDGSVAPCDRGSWLAASYPVLKISDDVLQETVVSPDCACTLKDDTSPARAMKSPAAPVSAAACLPLPLGLLDVSLDFMLGSLLGIRNLCRAKVEFSYAICKPCRISAQRGGGVTINNDPEWLNAASSGSL